VRGRPAEFGRDRGQMIGFVHQYAAGEGGKIDGPTAPDGLVETAAGPIRPKMRQLRIQPGWWRCRAGARWPARHPLCLKTIVVFENYPIDAYVQGIPVPLYAKETAETFKYFIRSQFWNAATISLCLFAVPLRTGLKLRLLFTGKTVC